METPPALPVEVVDASAPQIQKRNIVLYILLSLVTCGLFGIYWFCTLNDDTNKISGHPEAPNGVVALLLLIVTCGIYGLFWFYNMGSRIDEAKAKRGIAGGSSGALYLVLALLGFRFVSKILLQNELNNLAS